MAIVIRISLQIQVWQLEPVSSMLLLGEIYGARGHHSLIKTALFGHGLYS
jgi:hypothetical protein